MIKNSSQLNSPIDYSKFINFVSIMSKGNEEEKLQLLYTFFDRSLESKITKEDLKAHISGTILSMQSVAFDGLDELEKLKQSIAMAPENEIDQALDILVQEIFMNAGNQEELSFEEWKTWFKSLDGVGEILRR